MISDSLAHSERYALLHPRFAAAFSFLRALPANPSDGRQDIDGDRLFALVQSYTTSPAAEHKFEHHRKYADIQFLFAGEEIIEHAPLEELEVDTPYNAEKDFGLVHGSAFKSAVVLTPGRFGVYFPEDAHKPGCSLHAPTPVRKVVVKILL
jgi:YhcH/YjgK/YiaL family protein